MKTVKVFKALLVAVAAVLLGGGALLWQQGQADATVIDPAPEREPAALSLPEGDKGTAKKDLERLQGTWKMDSIEWSGKNLPKELMTGYKFVFAGNKLTWEGAMGMMSKGGKITAINGAYPCDFKIDPGQEPKQIDITLHRKTKDGVRDRTILGIYELKGDTLKVCYFTIDTGRRPVAFSQKGTDRIGFIVLTRAKK